MDYLKNALSQRWKKGVDQAFAINVYLNYNNFICPCLATVGYYRINSISHKPREGRRTFALQRKLNLG